VQRLFGFASYVYKKRLEAIADERDRDILTLRSTIPVFRRDSLTILLDMALPGGNTDEVLRLMTLDDTRDYIDLQYTPFIQLGDSYAIAPALVANTNLVRNIICSHSLHSTLVGVDDPMQQAVVAALEKSGFKVRSGFTTRIAGEKRETDIFAWRDGNLFIFECKNAYHPCSPHEMRNSFEHIKKGREQLDIRLEWLQNSSHQAALFKALGWDIPPTNEIHTGIVIANRVFSGSMQGRHPVRQAHELINVVLRGEFGGTIGKFSFWSGLEFEADDLVAYLRGETVVADQFAALEPVVHTIAFGKRSLCFESYGMDMQKFADRVKARYPSRDNASSAEEIGD
jgi:hypothetical protein